MLESTQSGFEIQTQRNEDSDRLRIVEKQTKQTRDKLSGSLVAQEPRVRNFTPSPHDSRKKRLKGPTITERNPNPNSGTPAFRGPKE